MVINWFVFRDGKLAYLYYSGGVFDIGDVIEMVVGSSGKGVIASTV
jgi:hypothetical protein